MAHQQALCRGKHFTGSCGTRKGLAAQLDDEHAALHMATLAALAGRHTRRADRLAVPRRRNQCCVLRIAPTHVKGSPSTGQAREALARRRYEFINSTANAIARAARSVSP